MVVKYRFAIGALLPPGLRDGINQVYWSLTDRRAGYTRASVLPGPAGAGAGVAEGAAYTWDAARAGGLTSDLFDVDLHNVGAGDTRAGLEGDGARRIEALMHADGLSFDQARLRLHHDRLRANGIDPRTGLPLDKKAVLSLGSRAQP